MAAPQQHSGRENAPRREQNSITTIAAFVVGIPLAAGILSLIRFLPMANNPAIRYVSHPVECVEVIMFCCAVAGLGAKLWLWRTERSACRRHVLPTWDGQAVPVGEAAKLLAGLQRLPRYLENTYLMRRVSSILDFLCRRGSAVELDDHLRSLADNDSVALESSYSLIRFITWAIPILGFLGTVLGITGAISGVTPEKLESSLNEVTDGLALAFDTTALALALTMITMFFSFVVDRAEQSVLETIDRYVDRHLAHRFERAGAEGGKFIEVVRQNTEVLVQASEQLVQRQAGLWAKTVDEMALRHAEAEKGQHERMLAALETALENTLESHARRLASLEKHSLDLSNDLLARMTTLAHAVRDTGREQQTSLSHVADSVGAQASALVRLQDGDKQLVHLQESLNHNLNALVNTGNFEQAVHSLTAAIHLLTARTSAQATQHSALSTPHSARSGVAA